MSFSFGCSSEQFASDYQGQRPFLIKAAVSSDSLLQWRDVNELFARSDPMSDDFKLLFDGVRPKHEYVESYIDVGTLRHRLIKPVVYDFLRRGATLVSNKIKNEPVVERFAREVAFFTGRQVVSSGYIAFGTKDSFRCHWDTRDVFAIQLIGRKRWIVYEPSLEAPLFTQQSKDFEHRYPCPSVAYMDIVLEPGDMLYVPNGWWHNPLPVGEPGFHLSVGTFPALTIDFLQWVLGRMETVTAARQPLSRWDSDRHNLDTVAHEFTALMTSSDEYGRFMQHYLSHTRIDSTLAVERFGDEHADRIPSDARLRLCASNVYGLDEGYLIANGTKLMLDQKSAPLIRHLAQYPGTTFYELGRCFPLFDSEKVTRLLNQLCAQDILEIVPCDDRRANAY